MSVPLKKTPLVIDCISDLHGFCPDLPGGDLLLVAGDLTARDTVAGYEKFAAWLKNQPYRCKVVIAGNHDGLIEAGQIMLDDPENNIHYLCDSGMEFERLKIWGSPYTPTFQDWHFMRNRGEDIQKHWDLIPAGIDILITHGPPFGIFDKIPEGTSVGCVDLKKAVVERVRPKLLCFGHIHEDAENKITIDGTTYINCSFVDEDYRPVHHSMRVVL